MEQISFKIPAFEGPLDLLLHLISKNKVSIYDIPISMILEQYMDYIEKMNELNLDVTGDFLVMAAKLMYIKSKMLLPSKEETEDPRDELVYELIKFKQYKESAAILKNAYETGNKILVKNPEGFVKNLSNLIPVSGDISELLDAFNNVLTKIERMAPPSKKSFNAIKVRNVYSVSEKRAALVSVLREKNNVSFNSLFSSSMEKGEVVAIFLSLLELIKESFIKVSFRNKNNPSLIYNKVGDTFGNS